ncbi:MAG: D-alanine--D-alanine ligase [Clostridia bacterium]|nr:D-alanine--D-alanine ligase [Clostridia bacterium]
MQKLKLGVIFGGMSTEHDVSIVSGTSIIQNLNKEKYEIFPIYINPEGKWFLVTQPVSEIKVLPIGEQLQDLKPLENEMEYLRNLDVVFPVLHGLYGEDGTVQGLLELLKVKYVGCKVLSSSICMDKIYAKAIFEKANIPQANYVYVRKLKNGQYAYIDKSFNESVVLLENAVEQIINKLGLPVFVKPSNSGSSVGVKKASTSEELRNAIVYAAQYDTKILIEEEIVGREVECAVLGTEEVKASKVGEILSAENFYTFDAKYKNQASRVVIPAQIPEKTMTEIQNLAIKAFKAVDGTGLSRVDFFIRKSDGMAYINEINTMPGFTQISMYPKLWEEAGISYEQLLDELVELASK